MELRVIASIITYNPDITRLDKNINSIINNVDEVILIDNDSSNINDIRVLCNNQEYKNRIVLKKNLKNIGISSALNQALIYSEQKKYNWLLTLDQDSICSDNMIDAYKNVINKIKNIESIGIIAPKIINGDCEDKYETIVTDSPYTVITSGSLTNVKNIVEIGGFYEPLFIDYVDHEICLRLRDYGYEIIRTSEAKLFHELGDISCNKILNIKFKTTNHSALRRYYYFRNCIFVHKKFFRNHKKWVLTDILRSIKIIIGIVLFERDKNKKLRFMCKGIKDAIGKKFGEYGNI